MKRATKSAVDRAIDRHYNRLTAVASRNALKAHMAGGAKANQLMGVELSPAALEPAALAFARDYGRLLVDEGATVIKGEKVYWLADRTVEQREKIYGVIEQGLKEGKPTGIKRPVPGTIAYDLKEHCLGPEHRSMTTIARTEIARIQRAGATERYVESGVVEGETWLCGQNPCPICQELCGKTFPIGEAPEQPHPNCTCDTKPVLKIR